MTVLITGASGFIGSRLVKAACDAFGTDAVIAFSSGAVDGCRSIIYDGADYSVRPADAALLDGVEVLLHAGAYTPKSGPDANASAGCNANIRFTEKLLGLPWPDLKKIVYLSTIDVYEQADLITESTPTLPATLYGLSKLYGERQCALFAAQRKIACQILRIGHVYGPGEEKYAKFLPRAIASVVAGRPVELWGDGSELRSLIYIDDVVAATLKAVGLAQDVGVVNVVGGTALPIRQIVERLREASDIPVEIVVREFNGAKRDFVFDNARLKAHLLPAESDLTEGLRAEIRHMQSLR